MQRTFQLVKKCPRERIQALLKMKSVPKPLLYGFVERCPRCSIGDLPSKPISQDSSCKLTCVDEADFTKPKCPYI